MKSENWWELGKSQFPMVTLSYLREGEDSSSPEWTVLRGLIREPDFDHEGKEMIFFSLSRATPTA